ncbi:hypothetical protein GpartN1_g1659.t1 [Galdieria partita]|uniref:Probable ATP-dependent transporter ycf16 n=1 Tax=Galdieria partita TaxID=83374 RepID=A0A9C7PSH0_9RHOD|nr:hypothetical protein GpartN1_g1659.t1 [Galdieria partita]
MFNSSSEIETPLHNHNATSHVTLPSAVSLRGVNLRTQSGSEILTNIDWDVFQGSTAVVIGPSGSGKTRLVRLLNRLDEASSGHIDIFGLDIKQWNPQQLRRKVVYVAQTPYLSRNTVLENLEIICKLGVISKSTFERSLDEALEIAGFQKALLDHSVNTLSGGEKQRLSIARALLLSPEILVLDEPTSSLDGLGAQSFLQRLNHWRQKSNSTLIVISHRFADLSVLGGQLLMLNSGKAVLKGETSGILNSAEGEQVRKLLSGEDL